MPNQVIFNGTDLSQHVMVRPHRPIMPPITVVSQAVGGRHGEVFKRARMDAYEIPVEMWLRTEDREMVANLRHTLAALLWTEEPAPLYLPDDPDRYHLAVVSGITDLGAVVNGLPGCMVNFKVCDPIAYGAAHSVSLRNNYATDITVGGTWESRPTITTTLAGGTWRITNVTTAEYVEVNAESFGAALSAGGVLVCDMENERVTIGGTTAGVAVASDFFSIEGTTKLRVTGSSSTTVEWRERWL